MAIFEKKLRSIANTIKDDYIKKYVLEYFLEKNSRANSTLQSKQKEL
jgi:DNA primase